MRRLYEARKRQKPYCSTEFKKSFRAENCKENVETVKLESGHSTKYYVSFNAKNKINVYTVSTNTASDQICVWNIKLLLSFFQS